MGNLIISKLRLYSHEKFICGEICGKLQVNKTIIYFKQQDWPMKKRVLFRRSLYQ